MPIFVFLHSKQEPVVTRGEYLNIWKRILLWLGFPVRFKAMQSEDVYNIPARSISHVQEFSDAELQRRIETQKAKQAAEARRNPNPGPAPKAIVPKGK